MLSLFVTAPRGIDDLLRHELTGLGASATQTRPTGLHCQATMETALKACLWSRLANRVLLPLHHFAAPDTDALYEGASSVAWEEHLDAAATFAVDVTLTRSPINHSHFAALRVKDAIVDRLRERCGQRPSVDVRAPAVRFNLHCQDEQATLSLDLSGRSLHRRGYRAAGASAPLKENLAAAILLRSGWPVDGPMVDPMCGSGTLLIEAALMAADIAPGLLALENGQPPSGWLQWDHALWDRLIAEARQRRAAGLPRLTAGRIAGFDINRRALDAAAANLLRAGLAEQVTLEERDIRHAAPLAAMPGPGHVVVNPPYGERMGEEAELFGLYARLGQALKSNFAGWTAHVFTQEEELGRATGLRARQKHALHNGALACQLLHMPLYAAASAAPGVAPSPASSDLHNRLRKNSTKLQRWLDRSGVTCYRVYDADLPEYAAAIDIYENKWVHVQEYEAPKTIDPGKARARLREILLALPTALPHLRAENIFLKVRRKQRGSEQYTRQGDEGRFHQVHENGATFWVNFTDYLDTGLFLDHRPLRATIQKMAAGKHFLNLFGYTGSASVCAALGGAASTTTVDMSATYLDWAERNLQANRLAKRDHELVQMDCLRFLADSSHRYDLILLDPPTFSNSKRMTSTLDVQRDHAQLIHQASALLAPGGTLFFSNNARRFKLDAAALTNLQPRDITAKTIPEDFARNPRIHGCWQIDRPSS